MAFESEKFPNRAMSRLRDSRMVEGVAVLRLSVEDIPEKPFEQVIPEQSKSMPARRFIQSIAPSNKIYLSVYLALALYRSPSLFVARSFKAAALGAQLLVR